MSRLGKPSQTMKAKAAQCLFFIEETKVHIAQETVSHKFMVNLIKFMKWLCKRRMASGLLVVSAIFLALITTICALAGLPLSPRLHTASAGTRLWRKGSMSVICKVFQVSCTQKLNFASGSKMFSTGLKNFFWHPICKIQLKICIRKNATGG